MSETHRESRPIRIGSRGSPLAVWQAEHVRELLLALDESLDVEICRITSSGEKFPDHDFLSIGVGVFTREIDAAVLDGRVDLGVHSLKDLPTELAAGLTLAAVPERASPHDAWIAADGCRLADLPVGARVGTSSPRRAGQLLHRRPDLDIVPLRGNVDTRLRKIQEEALAGTILAEAGLARLGRDDRVTERVPLDWLLPAVGQGALAIVSRHDDDELLAVLRRLQHDATRCRVDAERAFLRALRGGCQVPAGALATLEEGSNRLRLEAILCDVHGKQVFRAALEDDAGRAQELGARLAEELIESGGAAILEEIRARADAEVGGRPARSYDPGAPFAGEFRRALGGRRIVVTRAESASNILSTTLERYGAKVLQIPTIRFTPPEDESPLRDALREIGKRGTEAFGWIIFTSSTAIRFFFEAASAAGVEPETWNEFPFGVVGPSTGSQLASMGVKARRVVIGSRAETLANILLGKTGSRPTVSPGVRCLLPQADIARPELQERLREGGVEVHNVVAYRTVAESSEKAAPFLQAIEAGERIDGVTFASPSAFVNFLEMTAPHGEAAIRRQSIPLFSIGPTTSHAIIERGLDVAGQGTPFTMPGLIQAVFSYFDRRPPVPGPEHKGQ